MNIYINQQFELEIEGLGSNGEGVARHDGLTVFVRGALPTEKVLARIVLIKKNYAVATLIKVLQSSIFREEPRCLVYKQCGGCQLQHLSYEGQLKVKQQQVVDALHRIGHLSCQVLSVFGMNNPWYYRNKMQFPISRVNGKLEIGCYAIKTHEVVNVKECLIQRNANNAVLAGCRQWMQKYCISVYDEKTQQGLVRHVMGRVAQDGVMAVVITNGGELPYQDELVKILQDKIPDLCSVVQNINDRHTNVIIGNKSKTIWGNSYIKENINNLHFSISAESFFQVNTLQAEVLYNQVLKYAGLTGSEIVVDVYCGTGTISLYLAQYVKCVYGIELVAKAIENANNNAKMNNIDNVNFICGDAVEELPKLLRGGIKPDVVVVDPPRSGCDRKVLTAIVEVMPKRIVYVSCNPATLARDLEFLSVQYLIGEVQPVDMFPQTTHIETVVELINKPAT